MEFTEVTSLLEISDMIHDSYSHKKVVLFKWLYRLMVRNHSQSLMLLYCVVSNKNFVPITCIKRSIS